MHGRASGKWGGKKKVEGKSKGKGKKLKEQGKREKRKQTGAEEIGKGQSGK